MLALLRVIFGFALFSVFAKALKLAGPYPQTEGTTDAGYMALAVIIGIANAIVWAPLVGRLISDPLTGAFTSGNPGDFKNSLLQLANKLALRRWRKTALFFAFLEGVRHPDLPGAFILGLHHARSGTWVQRIFAREVWRFDNAENCLQAWKVLRAHGKEPGIHRRPEVNLLILSAQRERAPEPGTLAVRPAPAAPAPARNPRIQLFAGATAPEAVEPMTSEPTPETTTSEGAGEAAPTIGPTPLPDGGAPAAPANSTEGPVADEGIAPSTPKATRPLTFLERLRVLVTGRPPTD